MHFMRLPVCTVSCLLQLQHLQCLVCRLMVLTIAHFMYFVHSQIQISDYPPGNAPTTLTELSRSRQYCTFLPPHPTTVSSMSCHKLPVNSECSISTKNFIGKQSPVYQQSCATEVKVTFHPVQEAQCDATYQSIPFLSSTLTC
jgi:hypothetical protein